MSLIHEWYRLYLAPIHILCTYLYLPSNVSQLLFGVAKDLLLLQEATEEAGLLVVEGAVGL